VCLRAPKTAKLKRFPNAGDTFTQPSSSFWPTPGEFTTPFINLTKTFGCNTFLGPLSQDFTLVQNPDSRTYAESNLWPLIIHVDEWRQRQRRRRHEWSPGIVLGQDSIGRRGTGSKLLA